MFKYNIWSLNQTTFNRKFFVQQWLVLRHGVALLVNLFPVRHGVPLTLKERTKSHRSNMMVSSNGYKKVNKQVSVRKFLHLSMDDRIAKNL